MKMILSKKTDYYGRLTFYFNDMEFIEKFWASLGKKVKPNQLQRYVSKGSPECIRKFIAIGGGPKMGMTLENFARYKFTSLKKRGSGKNTGFDHTFTVGDKVITVEQKSSGHWGDDDYKWQHVEPGHNWNMLLLCGIDYQDIKFWAMNRKTFDKLVSENKITNQGNKAKNSSEGYWFSYSVVKEHLTPIETDESLLEFARTQV